MSARNEIISDCTIVVNNVSILTVPDSCSLDPGFGEQSIVAASAGGNKTVGMYSRNAKSNISHFKGDVFSTQELQDLTKKWKIAGNTNSLLVINNGTGKVTPITNCALTNMVEFEIKTDGKIKLEFKGDSTLQG